MFVSDCSYNAPSQQCSPMLGHGGTVFPHSLSSHLFICLILFLFVYSSIGCSHGEGRCPWRTAQQESTWDGWLPEEVWILKQPVPNYLRVHPCHPVAFTLLPVLVCSLFFFFAHPSLLFIPFSYSWLCYLIPLNPVFASKHLCYWFLKENIWALKLIHSRNWQISLKKKRIKKRMSWKSIPVPY